jgi:hypothetical protein
MPPEEDGPDRFAAGVDVALYRAPLVEVILKAEPIGAIKVPSSRPRTRMGSSIFGGRRLGEWATAIAAEDSEGGRYVRRLADASRPLRCLRLCPPCPAGLQGVCKDLQERLQGVLTGFSPFLVDPTRADSCDIAQPYAHRAEIERLD